MLLAFTLILCGYFGIAAIRSLIVATRGDECDDSELIAWAKKHPYHFLFKGWAIRYDKEAALWALFGIPLALASWIAPFGILLQGNLRYFALWPFCIGGMGLYFSVAMGYWLYPRGTFSRIWQKAKNWWQSRVPAELAEAQKYQKALKAIIKDKKRQKQLQPILKKIDKLVKAELPRLLNLNIELGVEVIDAQKTINRQKDNGICDGEEALMAESEKGLEILLQRQENVKKRIAYILSSLDHMSVRFDLIMSAESTDQGQKEISEVLEDLDIMLKAKQDVDGLFHELAMNGVPELEPLSQSVTASKQKNLVIS
ncbi:MAG: hypothetical protein WC460_02250 [Patescibacteria group bacterium]